MDCTNKMGKAFIERFHLTPQGCSGSNMQYEVFVCVCVCVCDESMLVSLSLSLALSLFCVDAACV